MDLVQKNLLEQVAGLHEVPEGAYNIRANGKKVAQNTTANIDIVTKEDKDGIDIIIKPGTVNESVHIPVVLSESENKKSNVGTISYMPPLFGCFCASVVIRDITGK